MRASGATAGTGRPEPRYSDDARSALKPYREAAVAGAAYWDHAYLLVALVHEVGPRNGMGLEVPFRFARPWLLRTLLSLVVSASGHPRRRFTSYLQAAASCILRGAVPKLCFQCRTPSSEAGGARPRAHPPGAAGGVMGGVSEEGVPLCAALLHALPPHDRRAAGGGGTPLLLRLLRLAPCLPPLPLICRRSSRASRRPLRGR